MEINAGVLFALLAGYVIGGLLCLAIAVTGLRGANRLTTGLVGVLSLGYAAYLVLGSGEGVFVFAVLIPFVVALGTLRNRPDGRRA